MKIAIDATPLLATRTPGHKVRGTGIYIENLRLHLQRNPKGNEYIFFHREDKLPADIDIIHYPYFEPFFLSLPLRKKTKTIVTVHDLTPLVFPKYFPVGVKGKVKWQLQKLALQKTDRIITDSKASQKD